MKKFASAFCAGWAKRRKEKKREIAAEKARKKQEREQEQSARRKSASRFLHKDRGARFFRAAKKIAIETLASPEPDWLVARMFAIMALSMALWRVGAVSNSPWIPQVWTDAAQQGFWGGVPDIAPEQMQVLRCKNGVFAQGAPLCENPSAVAGSAKGWKKRAQDARRGIFAQSDNVQTRRDLLATNAKTDKAKAAVVFLGGAILIALLWALALMAIPPFWNNCAWPARRKAGALLLGFSIAMAGAQLVGWSLERFGRPTTAQSRFFGAIKARAAFSGDEKASAAAFMVHDDRYLNLEAKKLVFGSTEDKNAIFAGVWTQADLNDFALNGEKGRAAVEKKAPDLSEKQRDQARWAFAKAFGEKVSPIETFFGRAQLGLAFEFWFCVAMGSIYLFWVFSVEPIVQDIADKARRIAQDGEEVLLAKKERDILAHETDAVSDFQKQQPKKQARRI